VMPRGGADRRRPLQMGAACEPLRRQLLLLAALYDFNTLGAVVATPD
jgi:hypothetical protein